MKKATAQTIIQQIQPQCNTLHLKIKDEKDRQHETSQSIADHTGIPISNVAKLFSGSLSSPSVFYIAAICVYLHLSLDGLMEIMPPKEPDTGTVAELQNKLNSAEQQIEHLSEKCRMLEDGIKERKPVIYALAGLCIFLSVAMCSYIVMDISNMDFGFFTAENRVERLGLLAVAVIAVILTAMQFIEKARTKRKKDKDNDNLI